MLLFPFLYYRQLNLPQIQKILQEFEKQSEIMDMKEEIMNDAIDDAMEDEGDEEERYFKVYIYIYYRVHIFFMLRYVVLQITWQANYWSCQLLSLTEIDIL